MSIEGSQAYKDLQRQMYAESTLVKMLFSDQGHIYPLVGCLMNDYLRTFQWQLRNNPEGIKVWIRGRHETLVHIEVVKGHG